MRKIMDLPDDTTVDDLQVWAAKFFSPIAVKLRKNLELWIEDEPSVILAKETELESLKRLFSHLARDAPSSDSPYWGEYEATMRQLEAELREKGVDL